MSINARWCKSTWVWAASRMILHLAHGDWRVNIVVWTSNLRVCRVKRDGIVTVVVVMIIDLRVTPLRLIWTAAATLILRHRTDRRSTRPLDWVVSVLAWRADWWILPHWLLVHIEVPIIWAFSVWHLLLLLLLLLVILLLALHVVGSSRWAHNTVFCHLILVLWLVLLLGELILQYVVWMLMMHHLVRLGVHVHVSLPASVIAHWGDWPGCIVLGGLLWHYHRLGQIADHRVFIRVVVVLRHVSVARLLLLVLGMLLILLSEVIRTMALVPTLMWPTWTSAILLLLLRKSIVLVHVVLTLEAIRMLLHLWLWLSLGSVLWLLLWLEINTHLAWV